MQRKALGSVATAALLASMGAYAHHSFTATHDEDRTIKIECELVQFLFRSPHAFVH